jgi:hypothetical protein
MATCEFCETCSFFKKDFPYYPHTKEFLCNTLCNGDFITCARYQIAMFQGIDNVPPKLLPDPLKCLKCFATCDAWN